ncbi:MAG: MATE family efflux transporter [Oscillospiraceae bacterium]|nr:MATE family efflux transporter [Oscillospiraceae bacterium]
MSWITRDKSFYKTLVSLSVPLMLQNIITYSVNLADNVMVGSLGEAALSGVFMSNQIQSILQMLASGLSAALTVLATQYWGRRDLGSIKQIIGVAMKFSMLLAFLCWAAVFFFPAQVLGLFTNEPAVIEEGMQYIRIVCFSYLFFVFTNVLVASMRCVETVRIGMYLSIVTLVTNVSLNWVLIFGHFGAPALGIRGAAIATLISRMVECAIILVYVKRVDQKLHLKFRELLHSSRALVGDFFRYGFPVILGDLTWGLNMATQGAIIGRLGAAAISSVSIANTLLQILSVGVYGLAGASSILIGKTVGSGDYARVKQYARTLQLVFLAMGLVTGALVFFSKDFIITTVYQNLSPETLQMASRFLTVLSVTIVGTAYQMSVLTGVVRAGGATHFVLINDLIFVWLIVIPSACVAAFWLHADPWVVFACLKCDQVLKCAVAVVKVNRFRWIKNLTRDAA